MVFQRKLTFKGFSCLVWYQNNNERVDFFSFAAKKLKKINDELLMSSIQILNRYAFRPVSDKYLGSWFVTWYRLCLHWRWLDEVIHHVNTLLLWAATFNNPAQCPYGTNFRNVDRLFDKLLCIYNAYVIFLSFSFSAP